MEKRSKEDESCLEIQRLLERQRAAFFMEIRHRIGNSATSEQTILQNLNDDEKRYFRKIEAAFKRLEEGNLNVCKSCNGNIDFRRLKARPISTRCIQCQMQEEEKEKGGSTLEELNGESFLSGSFLGRGCRP